MEEEKFEEKGSVRFTSCNGPDIKEAGQKGTFLFEMAFLIIFWVAVILCSYGIGIEENNTV